MPTWYPSSIIRQNDADDFGRQSKLMIDDLGNQLQDANKQISGHVQSLLPSLESLMPWAQPGQDQTGAAGGFDQRLTPNPSTDAGPQLSFLSSPSAPPASSPARDDYARPSSALPSLESLTPWAPQVQVGPISSGRNIPSEGYTSSGSQRPDEYNTTSAETVQRGGDLHAYARQAAERNGVDPNIFERQIQQESGFNPSAGSPAGAQGIAQIMPQYHPGVDTSDPYASLDYAAQLMGQHLKTYGGDYRKALQAYNAGPGAVASGAADSYGETNSYVGNILGGADAGVSPAVAGNNSHLPGAGQSNSSPDRVGDLQADQAALDDPDKWALCGPVAAVLAATKRGANWSVAQAKQLASSLGLWNADQGMAGLGSEVQLLQRLGIQATTGAADQQRLAEDAQNGNTPIVSTDGHYFVLQGYDPGTGKFDTGTTGTVYKGGSRWLSLGDMQNLAGNIQGAAYIDNPASSTPGSVASPTADTSRGQNTPVAGLDIPDKGSGVQFNSQLALPDQSSGDSTYGPFDPQGYGQSSVPANADPSDFPSTPPSNPLPYGPPQQDNPDQPSGLSQKPISSVTPTFTPADLETGNTQNGTVDPGALLRPGGDLSQAVRPHVPIQQLNDLEQQALDAEQAGDQATADDLRNQQISVMQNIALSAGGAPETPGPRIPLGEIAPKVPRPPRLPEGAQPITLTPEQEAGRLNLAKFPAEIHDDLLEASQGVDYARNQRRGVLPDAVVNDMADEMGRSVESWIRQKAGRAYSPEETVALRNAVTAQGFKVADLSSEITAAKSSGLTTDLLLAQFDAEATKLRGLVQVAEGARAEAGRTLRAYNFQTRNVEANPSDAAARLVKKFGGDRQKAIEAIGEFNQLVDSGAGPIEQAKFWARAEAGPVNFGDWFRALRYNSMLSGPRTFEINAVGNLAEIPWRLARDTGASLAKGKPQELAPEMTGLWVGMQKGTGAFMETLQHGITTEQALAGDLPRGLASRIQNPIGRTAATALEAPGRVMQASDAFAHQMAYGMQLGREAAVKARGAPDWAAEVEKLMGNPTEQMMSNALGAADRMTYKGEMGGLGEATSKLQQHWLGNIVMPFLRTVYHITARGIDRSPLGLVGTGIDVARGAYKNGAVPKGAAPLGERLGDNVMGTMAGAFLVGQAFQGNISASGPEDPRQKDLLRGQGWQPYSVKVGDKWISYSNWGPASVPFSMAAALAEGNLYKKQGQDTDKQLQAQALDTFRRFGELATEQTYLQGIGAFYKAAKDPQAYGTQWLTGFMNSLVPFGAAVNTVGQSQDPLMRRPEKYDVPGAFAARMPGLREGQPAAQDVLGRPIPNEQQGGGAFQPLRISAVKDDQVLKAFTDAGVEISRPSDAMTVDGVKISLTPAEQRHYLELRGQLIERFAPRVIATAGYQKAGPVTRQATLNAFLDDMLGAARDQMIHSIGGPEMARRVREGSRRTS